MTAIGITFSDLTHTGTTVDANYFPLGAGYVAAYAKQHFGDLVDVHLFKYPDDLAAHLARNTVRVACFSNYSWNLQLSYQVATRIKRHSPDTLIVFGGPNYPDEPAQQEAFLRRFPDVDFYVAGEGELAFAGLLNALMENGFDANQLAASTSLPQGVHFLKNGTLVRGEPAPRIQNLSAIPSPLLMGLFDKFIEADFIPMIQTNRGCPYSCTYCHDGSRYYSKLSRFPQRVYEQELDYLAKRCRVPFLIVADLNFGIRKEDYDTAKYIHRLSREQGWPKSVDLTAAKNDKSCISDIVELLGDTFLMGASVQSTSPSVLSRIKRKNLPLDELVALARRSAKFGGNSFSEIILCLPGDSKEAYCSSLFDLLDAGINEVRSYQFILLDGTEAASAQARQEFAYRTRWRVLPRCYGSYTFYGESFSAAEYHEVVVANSTMLFEDYLYCRKLGLLVEIFNNGRVFVELLNFLDSKSIKRSIIMQRLLSFGIKDQGAIGLLLREFESSEEENFFESRQELETFLLQRDAIERYISGELGKNQMLYYRAKALIEHLEDCCQAIFGIALRELSAQDKLDPMTALYLENLEKFVISRRGNLFTMANISRKFDFDMVKLTEKNFQADPTGFYRSDGIMIEFGHDPEQIGEIDAMLSQFGRSIAGLGHLMQRANVGRLYRHVRYLADSTDVRESIKEVS